MARGSFFTSTMKGFDAFGKTMEDVKVKTRTGALLTLISAAVICTFTMMEFIDYRRVQLDTSVVVDRSRGEKLNVNLNVTFPHVPCYLMSLEIIDVSGEHQLDVSHSLVKTRLDGAGNVIQEDKINLELKSDLDKAAAARGENYCGSCYGGVEPANGCCQTCEEVRQAYLDRGWSFQNPDAIEQCVSENWAEKLQSQSYEGCNIAGKLKVNKVVGNLHITPGRSFQSNSLRLHELVPYLQDGSRHHDFGHTIHHLSFENAKEDRWDSVEKTRVMREKLGIQLNPLDYYYAKAGKTQYMFQYFLKVVGTRYHFLHGEWVSTHQYSVTTYERDLDPSTADANRNQQGLMTTHGVNGMPGAFFNFEISPMLVVHKEVRQSFAHFLTSTCAIVGGVLTIASVLDSVLFNAGKAIKKAAEQNGKLM